MKKNVAVLHRVEKYRERKGIRVADSNGKLYLFFKIMYILSFVWFAAIHFLYFAGELLVIYDPEMSATVSMTEFYIVAAATVLIILGFIFMLKRRQEVGGIMTVLALPVDTYQFYNLLILTNKDIDSENIFLWRHLMPAILMLVFGILMCVIAIRAKALLNRDYKRVLEALYITHKDRLGSGTEADWEALLSELDDNAIESELDRQHTREYKRKKASEETAETEDGLSDE